MACEKVVIASNVSDNEKILNDACGRVFQTGDDEALAAAMKWALGRSTAELIEAGQSGRKVVKELCSIDVFRSKYIDLLEIA